METVVGKIKVEKYSSYKNSGAEWLGDIPTHWNTLSNKNIFKLKKNQVGKKSGDYVLLSLTLNGVIKRDMVNPQGKFPAEFNTYQEVKKGDFIFCLFDVEETPRCVGLSDFDGMITGAYTVMEPYDNFDRNFLYYFYFNLDADKRLKTLYTGLRNTIAKENFFSFKSFVPPKEEQTAIAAFLDRKTTLIDQAIGIKQKQIELLKERRQILIHKAVTRGLNPNVKLKDSGVEWIGEIPESWEVKRLKYVFKILKRIAGELGHNVLSITQTGIKIKDITSGEGQLSMDYSKYQYVFGGEFAMNHMDLLTGYVDISKYNGVISPDYRVFDLIDKNSCKEYMLLLLQLCYKNKVFYAHSQGVSMLGRWRFPSDNFNNFCFPIPSMAEQQNIVDFVNNSDSKISNYISLKEQEIEKLKEYKATLINSAVTGKLRVPSVQ
jgi:type I restriction enzyme S subunit